MWVATHEKIINYLKIMVIKENDIVVFYQDEHGNIDRCGINHLCKNFQFITLQCPHCNATLQQSERVECECGWIAIAQPEEFLDAFDWWAYNNDLVGLMTNGIGAPYPMDENTLCRRINKIWWLEISGGESDED